MKFFSGFALAHEEHFFKEFIRGEVFEVVGFSYGAIKAFEYVKKELENFRRVDHLTLLSPAFFQTKSSAFKKLQLRAFQHSKEEYLKQFIQSCFAPYEVCKVEHNTDDGFDELEELLMYKWNKMSLEKMIKAGVRIEVYLGGEDRIIDSQGALEFFSQVADVSFLKDANHFLITT